MARQICLNDDWRMGWTEYMGAAASPKTAAWIAKIPATVPGDVHMDLMREGMLPELYEGMNLDHAWWVEHKDWWYRREFPTPADVGDRRALLVFHGLDTFATVWLNGQLIGQAENMFIRHEFDVSAALRQDGQPNELAVRLAATRYGIRVDPNHGPLTWNPERFFCRKAQMSFGWDIAPRLVTAGIWRPVELVLVDSGRITNVSVRVASLQGGDVKAQVLADVDWRGADGQEVSLSGQVHGVAWTAHAAMKPGINTLSAEVVIHEAPLWWPIGYGKPNLVKVEAAMESQGRLLDRWSGSAGLRTIELIRQPQPSGAESFFFRCNGRDIFITGLNWTPLDAMFARVTPEKITRTLESLAGIGCNMMRVWGGGIYEPPHFYRECSRLGILIWQDFMMACGWYPQTDELASALAAEGEQVVRDLRGYPCMGIWSGDNENDAGWPDLAPSNRLTRVVLAEICRRLHGDIPYVPSSPWSPSGKTHPGDWREGDVHHYNHGNDYRDPASWDIRCRFMSEFGRLSLPSMEVIRKYFPAGTDWPLTGPMWKYHGADTTRLVWFRGPDRVLAELKACGRPEPRTIEEAVTASQELQAEGDCAWIERYCEDPEFGGFLLWNVADCWPQHSDSVIDWLGNKKVVFDRLKDVFTKVRRAHGGD